MKTVPFLLSLAMGAAAQQQDAASSLPEGGIRASKIATKMKTKRNAAVTTTSTTTQENTKSPERKLKMPRPSKDAAKREKRSQRKALGDDIHKKLFDPDHRKLVAKKKALKKKDAAAAADSKAPQTTAKGEQEKRDLKKTMKPKSGKDDYHGDGEGYDRDDRWGSGYGGGDSHDSWGGSNDDDTMDDDRGNWGNGGDSNGRFNTGGWGSSGKSGKDSGGWSGGSGKSGKDGGSGKSGKDGGWSGGSGKSGKDGGGSCDGEAYVTVTNLSFRQSFSEIFVMTATKEATWHRPIFIFGNSTNEALAELAQDASADEMVRRYDRRYGVEQTKIFNNFANLKDDEKFLRGGARARFRVRTSGDGHRLSIAAGLPFTNDGAVVLEGARIYDGAEYWLPAIDAGVEGNIQTCWSVAAEEDDFPTMSECSDDDLSDDNDNSIPGEGFVSMHRGIHDFDDKNDLEDLLLFPTCEDLELDKGNDNDRFAQYFFEIGYDDALLLCSNRGSSISGDCDPRDDENFLDFIDSSRVFDGSDDRYIELANESEDFDDFCDQIDDANKNIEDALKTLEPWLFDWRGNVAHVEIDCGGHGDGHYYGDWRQ